LAGVMGRIAAIAMAGARSEAEVVDGSRCWECDGSCRRKHVLKDLGSIGGVMRCGEEEAAWRGVLMES
jgi:hypothetical protein